MTSETIGTNAGIVWTALSTSGELTVKELKKITKIKADKVLFSALGWLAKEGKLVFDERDDDLYVWLA
ncbi:MAG: winged helix-turn-helix domain-containing protein [Tannerella sp.]|jgi:hypothetical protein|nr:winged helix-turn-helix domain-containing protein [Tannerella sp.]